MSKQRTKRVIGNWKMHGRLAGNQALLNEVVQGAGAVAAETSIGVCVPFPYLAQVQAQLGAGRVVFGAQDVSAHEQGAFTGEVAAAMVAEFGAHYAIVGHSERRAYHGERNETVAAKAQRALAAGLTPVVCVGETLDEREAGATEQVVGAQLDAVLAVLTADEAARIVVAYEPVWAIGTGKTASPEQAQAVHALLRAQLKAATEHAADMRIVYGGSVKADNAAQLFGQADIDGGLIGGASLKAADFAAICRAAH
ncbi:MAG: triose-phosphate isomerase [Burkholderia ambifaria]